MSYLINIFSLKCNSLFNFMLHMMCAASKYVTSLEMTHYHGFLFFSFFFRRPLSSCFIDSSKSKESQDWVLFSENRL